ncbi:MAG: 30S ribosomal protein S6 [Parcubacteria group bacterium]|jgi:ribosomal protein S6
MEYELLFFTQVSNESKISGIKKDLEEVITSSGGKMSGDFTDIGKRKFAHPIKRETHGFYSFVRFSIEDKDKLPEINKRISLNEKIMRHLIVKASEVGKSVSERENREANAPAPETKTEPEAEKKPVEEKAKADMNELDEKLNEILDKTPE